MKISLDEILKMRVEVETEKQQSSLNDSIRKAKSSWIGIENKPSARTLRKQNK